jgi:hypothetical protein
MADPGYAALDAMTRSLRELGPKLVEDAMPELGRALRSDVEATISAGTDPYGEPWPKTEDGELPLQGTKSAMRLLVQGTRITLSIDGYRARHNKGWAKGGVQRRILPRAGLLPPKTAERFRKILEKRFVEATGGA